MDLHYDFRNNNGSGSNLDEIAINMLLTTARSPHWHIAKSVSPTPLDFVVAALAFLATAVLLGTLRRDVLKQLPWSALIVLMLPHSLFGWLLGVYNLPWFVWLLTLIGTLLVSAVMSYELGLVGLRILVLAIATSAIALVAGSAIGRVAQALALALALAAVWFWAVGGARFRLEATGFNQIQALWALAIASWEGLWLGWMVDTFLLPKFGPWLIQIVTS
jgi:hypothetical protein